MPRSSRTFSAPVTAHLAAIAAAASLLLACAATKPEGPGQTSAPEAPDDAPVEAEPAAAEPRTIALTRTIHRAQMTEVFLDPGAHAALTLDADGGARLWPELAARPGLEAPIALPIEESTWVSLARVGDTQAYLVAAIDTAGGVRVGEVQVGAEARWRPLFEIPTTAPIYEIHALEGGRRLLALTRDHRIVLLDREGATLSAIDTPGYVPWQLRVAQRPGQAPAIVAVLAGPVRVQRIALADDRLEVVGEALEVALDRGPNRNDLLLSPDGAFVTSLRRPKAKGRGWSLEIIDLEGGDRRWIAGEVSSEVRPRLHVVEPTRALLESGDGLGHWVDLSAAKAVPAPVDRKALPLTPCEVVPLPGSSEGQRMLVALEAGVRAVPHRDGLIVDRLADADHLDLQVQRNAPIRAAIAPEGERAVWAWSDRLVLDAPSGEPRVVEGLESDVAMVAFVDEGRVLRLADDGTTTIHRWEDGGVLAKTRVSAEWGVRRAAFHRASVGIGGVLGIAAHRRSEPPRELLVGADGFGELRPIAAEEATRWPELLEISRSGAAARLLGVKAPSGLRAETLDGEGRLVVAYDDDEVRHLRRLSAEGATLADVVIDAGGIQSISAAPRGSLIAVIGQRSDGEILSVYDLDDGGRRWSRLYFDVMSLDWSADGARIAIAAQGGHILDAASGEIVRSRRELGIDARREPDAPTSPAVDAG